MRFIKQRKKRGLKLNGEPSYDLCSCCYSPHCNPSFRHPKVEKRLYDGLCPACGEPHDLCKCKSTKTNSKIIVLHNNKHSKDYKVFRNKLIRTIDFLSEVYQNHENHNEINEIEHFAKRIAFKTENGYKNYEQTCLKIKKSTILTKDDKNILFEILEKLSNIAQKL